MNKKTIALVLKFVVSGGLIWYLLGNVDLGAAKERVLGADINMIMLTLVVIIVQLFICVIRWRTVMQAINAQLPFMKAFQIYMIGFFFNQALPSSVGGDGVRIYKAYRSGLTLSEAVNGVMLERIATMLGLVVVVVIGTPFFIDRVGSDDAGWIIPSVTLLGIGGVSGLIVMMFLDRMPSMISHWRFVRGLALLAADTRRIFLSPVTAMKAMFWSVLGHANVAFGVYLMALSIDLNVTWLDCMVLFPPVLLVMTIPISIAGWGVREQAMVVAFGLIGVSNEGALVLSILFGLWGIALGLPGGVVWLMSSDRRVEEIPPEAVSENSRR